MKRIIILLIGILITTGVSAQKNYKIIKEDKYSTIKKVKLYVRIDNEVNETELKQIALKLKEKRPKFKQFWIYYLLPGNIIGNGAWATTHFNPELELKILGPTKESKEEFNKKSVKGEILNIWKSNEAIMPSRYFLVKENNEYFMKILFAKNLYTDASEIIEKVYQSEKNGLKKYNSNNPHNEYYIHEKNGNLGMYNESGKFKEAIKEK
jgi:hypothetical protein